MDEHLITARVFEQQSGQPVAEIQLNGRTFEAAGLLGNGTMRSFKLVRGSLIEPWSSQDTLVLRTENAERTIRVSTLPAEQDGYGLIFFVE